MIGRPGGRKVIAGPAKNEKRRNFVASVRFTSELAKPHHFIPVSTYFNKLVMVGVTFTTHVSSVLGELSRHMVVHGKLARKTFQPRGRVPRTPPPCDWLEKCRSSLSLPADLLTAAI